MLIKICNHNHPIRGGGDDLFLQKRPATAFDEVQSGIEFIRTINGDVQMPSLIQSHNFQTQLTGQVGCAGRGGHTLNAQPFGFHPLSQTPHHPSRR